MTEDLRQIARQAWKKDALHGDARADAVAQAVVNHIFSDRSPSAPPQTPEPVMAPPVSDFALGEYTNTVSAPLAPAPEPEPPTGKCDCGAALTQCTDCAVSDYQASNTGCATCCPSALHPHH